MQLLIVFTIGGSLILGAILYITLIGVAPWSNKKDVLHLQSALGLMLILFGVMWIIAWTYLVFIFGHDFFNAISSDARGWHFIMQVPLGLILLASGVAALRNWSVWRGYYLLSSTSIILSLMTTLLLKPPETFLGQLFRRVLPVSALVIIGGIGLFMYITDRCSSNRS